MTLRPMAVLSRERGQCASTECREIANLDSYLYKKLLSLDTEWTLQAPEDLRIGQEIVGFDVVTVLCAQISWGKANSDRDAAREC